MKIFCPYPIDLKIKRPGKGVKMTELQNFFQKLFVPIPFLDFLKSCIQDKSQKMTELQKKILESSHPYPLPPRLENWWNPRA